MLLCLIFSFINIRSFLVPYAYVSIESIDHILLSLFELKAILLISSVKTLSFTFKYLLFLILVYFLRFFFIFFKTI